MRFRLFSFPCRVQLALRYVALFVYGRLLCELDALGLRNQWEENHGNFYRGKVEALQKMRKNNQALQK